MRKLFAVLAALLALAAVMQLYFAAMGVFSSEDRDLFAIHGFNGQYIVRYLPVLLIIVGIIAKVGKTLIWLCVWVIVGTFVQLVLFILAGAIFGAGPDNPDVPIGATILLGFHGLVGLTIIGLAAVLARRAMMLAFPRPPKAVTPAA
ncbi:MAG: DUF6220 domain-containing protein [Rhodoglobus sp.]